MCIRDRAETVYLLMVVGDSRKLEGVVGLRDLIFALDDGAGGEPVTVRDLMKKPESVTASDDAEDAARRAVRTTHLVTPVVDEEDRLIGILTIDDANRIIDRADQEDAARAGASEPLDRPYLITSVGTLVRSRVVLSLIHISEPTRPY